MGGWFNRIGKYEASQMDYFYDGIKDEGQTLEYYQSKKVDVVFKNLETKEEKTVKVPLIELHDFIKDEDGTYHLSSSNEEKSLRNWLWAKLKDKRVTVKSAFQLSIHVDREHWNTCPDYFLNSEPLNDQIIITTNRKEFEIKDLQMLEWLGSRGFVFG